MDGTICAIATDHAPHARHEKDVPFEEAPFGVTGLETAFSALYTHLVEPGLLPLATLLERMSAGPARAYGLEAPRIEPGADANLVLLDTERTWRVDGGRLPLALGELLAARAGAEGRRAHDRRCRPGRPRGMTGLLLEDGELFPGEPVGAPGTALGEAVFATAMTGYQELATDPSYSGQILCFTAPMVGNYGVAPQRSESGDAARAAVIMREARGPAWTEWLTEHGVVGLTGVDTRALVLHLREHGACEPGQRHARGGSRPSGDGRTRPRR